MEIPGQGISTVLNVLQGLKNPCVIFLLDSLATACMKTPGGPEGQAKSYADVVATGMENRTSISFESSATAEIGLAESLGWPLSRDKILGAT